MHSYLYKRKNKYHRRHFFRKKQRGLIIILCVGLFYGAVSTDYSISGMKNAARHFFIESVFRSFAPCLSFEEKGQEEGEWALALMFPYEENAETEYEKKYETEIESPLSYERIVALEAADENYVDEETGEVIMSSSTGTEEVFATEKVVNYSMDKLADFDYLIQNFYQVDKTTTINSSQLNAAEMLEKDMTLTHDASSPQILIYHTHSQEAYADSAAGDAATSVIGVADYLTELLQGYGYNVIHHKGEYDVEDRDHAYSLAGPALEQILAENPSIEVVIDLHRDGVGENTRLVTTQNGTNMAQIMFFNGLSRTTSTGDIAYLNNPYIADNLAFSFQMQLAAAEYYPGLTRRLYLKGYRYNMHYCPKTLLVEVGAQTNTFEEAKNSMVPLADILNKVLSGTE